MSDISNYNGSLFQVLQRTKDVTFQVEEKTVVKHLEFEIVRRPPGVRALVVQDSKLLLNYEYRYELENWDYRLPGGKVFDTNDSYNFGIQEGNIIDAVINALKKELKEESDIEVINYSLLNISRCGLTVEWDLYYFLIDQYIDNINTLIQKSEYEFIQTQWVDFSTALELCLSGKISETRSAYEIMRYILNRKKYI